MHADAPPTTLPPSMTVKKRPIWPTVVGIILIAFGALGLFEGIVGAMVVFMYPTDLLREGPGGDAMAEMLKSPTYYAMAAVTAVISLIGLWGGILLLRRRSAGRMVLLVWAVIALIQVLLGAVWQYIMMRDMMGAIVAEMGMSAQQQAIVDGIVQLFGVFIVVLSVVLNLALPVFTLVWLNRHKIREQVAQW
ncbi:MAG: hypothetical protein KAS72_00775 [Phycisphaerales bacterium]|nr:hypothetical protein [Phycisphaerales bacterium]